jgi:hypothetical protein
VIDEEQAVGLVRAELEREFARSPGHGEPLVVIAVERHELGWLVTAQSAEYARTGDLRAMLVGGGPYLVDAQDASLHYIPGPTHRQDWEAAYRYQVRGETPPEPADVFAEEVRAVLEQSGRLAALKHLRHHTRQRMTLRQAQRYLDSLAAAGMPPRDLAALTPRPYRPPLHLPIISVPTGPVPVRAARHPGLPDMVGGFRELGFGEDDGPSIHLAVRAAAQPDEEELVDYLRAGTLVVVTGSTVTDELDPLRPRIATSLALLTDGAWMWRSDLAHYVGRYHFALDPRFVAHARDHGWRPAPVTDARLRAFEDAMAGGEGQCDG